MAGYARFQSYPQGTFIALDTKTGILCQTYPDPQKGADLPLCAELVVNEKAAIRRFLIDAKPIRGDLNGQINDALNVLNGAR